MKAWVLGSGSEGNAVLIECGDSRVLVDQGFARRTLALRLRAIGVAPQSIEACILTHEHGDHMSGAVSSAKRWGWSLYASAGTVDACEELQEANCTRVTVGGSVDLSRMTLATYGVPHDSASAIGVRVTSHTTGASTAVCTDLGHVNDSVRALCKDADLLILEANHDMGMLMAGPYPPSVRHRIAGRSGHLSNRACADLARDSVHRNLTHVVLAHLSDKCNDRGIAHQTVTDVLRRTRFRGTTSVSMQHGVVGPFTPRASRVDAESQYSLAF